ncbi:copper-transporting ATPase [Achlya hypogyna]|uniref:Copper-transporting ATPase n=1 Tax=Achlya hypogyna TaxID=1202772 RepID=A0A1V9ZD13_ACHHY|nr:copper-transporting ATPase [Achlya hypogyna]
MEVHLLVKGMRCQRNCANRIQKALEAVPGVESAVVSFKDKDARVRIMDGASVSAVNLIQAVRGLDAGATKSFDAYMPGDDRSARVIYLHVDGMSCAMNCAKKVEAALAEADGVKAASVDFPKQLATISIEPGSRINETDLVATVTNIKGKRFSAFVVDPTAPPPASSPKASPCCRSEEPAAVAPSVDAGDVTLTIVGMTCNSCANSVETALRQTDGVVSAIVNFATESAYVKFIKEKVGIRSLVEVVEGIGYEASVATGSTTVAATENRVAEVAAWKRRLYLSLFFTFPIVIIMTVLDNIPQVAVGLQSSVFGIAGTSWDSFLLLLLATPVQFVAAAKFHTEAYKGLMNRVLGMSFLVSMGTNAAYFYGLFSDVRCIYWANAELSVPDMYMTSTMLVTFILLGKTMEAIAKGRTNDALRKLFELQAKVQ